MIGTISIKCNAAHPEIALPTIYTHADSPSSIRIIDVPKKIGNWQITSVYVNVIYPDGTTLNKQCVLTGGAWVATIEGNDTVGETKNGYTVLADGTDELGNDVSGYVLGVGGVKVIQSNPAVDPEEQYTLMRLYEQEPTELKDGATYIDDGHLAVYADGDVVKCANESDLPDMDDYYTKSDVDDKLDFFDERYTAVKYSDGTIAAYNITGELVKASVLNMDSAVEVRVGTNVTSIGNNAFKNSQVHASPLRKVTLPNTITSIGNSAFNDTVFLTSLVIPDSVTSIGQYAFEFSGVHNLKIPKSVTTIGQRAFASIFLTDNYSLIFLGRT